MSKIVAIQATLGTLITWLGQSSNSPISHAEAVELLAMLDEKKSVWPVTPGAEYVVGFLFSKDRSCVALIQKKRPEWQAGRWNGIGGKIEPGESPADAMRREFQEEAGVSLPGREFQELWEPYATISGPEKTPGEVSFRVHYFRCFSSAILNLESCTDEQVNVFGVHELPKTMTNVPWLIAMALSMDEERAGFFEVVEVPR